MSTGLLGYPRAIYRESQILQLLRRQIPDARRGGDLLARLQNSSKTNWRRLLHDATGKSVAASTVRWFCYDGACLP